MYICQFKKTTKFIFLLLALFVIGCATKKIVLPTNRLTANWFNSPEGFIYRDYEGSTVGHLFFDFAPQIDVKSHLVDVVISTPRDSQNHYDIDLVSGRFYKERTFCKEEDIWKNYTSSIERPNFSWAFVPRLLNRNGKPQRVAVFGDLKYLVDGSFPKEESVQVQILGAYIVKSCLTGLCDLNNHWKSEVILIAKSMLDESLHNAQGLTTLKKYIDWGYFKAFIENSMGRNEIGRTSKGAYRLESPILPSRALKYVINSGHLFSNSELATLKKSCRVVYSDALKLFDKKKDLSDRLKKFYQNDWNKFDICRKFVRHYDIKKEKDKHWKIEYLTAFKHAAEIGFYYDCRLKTWVRNIKNNKGEFIVNQGKIIGGCRDENLADAFPSAVSLLASISQAGTPYYRYIEYDSGADTFNQKIYNWVLFNGKKQSCDKSDKKDIIFPSDISFNL